MNGGSDVFDGRGETMDEHMAALALTSLSCSPVSPIRQSAGFNDFQGILFACLFVWLWIFV